MKKVSGKIVDVISERIYSGTISFENGSIIKVEEDANTNNQYILPGLIDAHVHVESSMLIPSEFAKVAVTHGTIGTVSDPHEIANVLGIDGVKFMVSNGKKTPFKFCFGAPSCVPATPFESSGAELGVDETEELLKLKEIGYLAEMMNFPGVLFQDKNVIAKLDLAKKYNKPIDGHAPGLQGDDAKKYANAGISTDHECFTIEEAYDKINDGMKVLIREGSAAKNFDTLIPLIEKHPDQIMFCSDDKHPDDLIKGHINLLVKRALKSGYDLFKVLRACTLNPIKHYRLNAGLLQKNDPADFIIVNNLDDFKITKTFINGQLVAENGKSFINPISEKPINKFNADKINASDITVFAKKDTIKVIEAYEGQLITGSFSYKPEIKNGYIQSSIKDDVLKLVVLNRYQKSKPAVAYINGFGLRKGAIASTVAHDSHNIIAVGTNDHDIVQAINSIIKNTGGIAFYADDEKEILALPFAGIMSGDDAYKVASDYEKMDYLARKYSKLNAPFMTLSFMALLVIPKLKLSDKGLFDGNKFEFTSLFTI